MNQQQRVGGRKCKRNSGNHKDVVIRIRSADKRELQFLKGILPRMNSMTPDGEVLQYLLQMFKDKKIGQLSSGKDFKSPLEVDSLATFYTDKEAAETIKGYEYLLQDKQQTLDNYIQYLNTACELGQLNKNHVIEIVQRNKRVSQTKDVVV